uniref:hypothetical protein n=1 Tax=Massilia sp. PWRC2 TaxID=2804626 RepID=UPI003CF642A7
YLSADCVNALASTLMHELDLRTDLELPIRNALIHTAAAIAQHGHDCTVVEAVTGQLFHRIGSTGDTLD